MPKGTIQTVNLVETSRSMREVQKTMLTPGAQAGGWDLAWLDSIEELDPSEDVYTMIVAHEFFDALPIHVLKVPSDRLFLEDLALIHAPEHEKWLEGDPNSLDPSDWSVWDTLIDSNSNLVTAIPRFR